MSWFLDQIPFLHGGLLRGPESGLKTAYFVQYLDSRRLILHFYIFTFLHFYMGVCSGVQNLGLGRFSPISGLETANFTSYIFTFLHFYMGVCLGVQKVGLRRLIFSNIWTQDG